MSLTARPTPAGRMAKYAPGISAPFGYSPEYKSGKVFHNGQDYFWLTADPAGSRKVYAAHCLATCLGTVAQLAQGR